MGWIKNLIFPIIVLSAISPGLALAQATSATKLSIFKEAVDAIGAAGDAIAKLTDGIAHLVKTGNAGWTYVSAHNTYSRLLDISARATHLAGAAQMPLVDSIDQYLAKPYPTTHDWDIVKKAIGRVVIDIKELLDDLSSERSDFVREDAYSTLVQTLAARSSLIEKLATLPQPETPEEREALREINERYKQLLSNFKGAIKELNAYLKLAEPA